MQKGLIMSKILGQMIQEQLKKLKISQRELALRACVKEAALSRYISGDREPDYDTLANIATALHTTIDYLLGEKKNEYSFPRIRAIVARNSSKLTPEERKILINTILEG